jgi:hypothetical protein
MRATAQGPEACGSMLTLGRQAYASWKAAYLVLKPMKKFDDGRNLVVQFFWLARGSRSVRSVRSLLNTPSLQANWRKAPSLLALEPGEGKTNLSRRFHRTSHKRYTHAPAA